MCIEQSLQVAFTASFLIANSIWAALPPAFERIENDKIQLTNVLVNEIGVTRESPSGWLEAINVSELPLKISGVLKVSKTIRNERAPAPFYVLQVRLLAENDRPVSGDGSIKKVEFRNSDLSEESTKEFEVTFDRGLPSGKYVIDFNSADVLNSPVNSKTGKRYLPTIDALRVSVE